MLSPIDDSIGQRMHDWARDLFPFNRSLTGPGVRQSLAYLQGLMPGLAVHAVPSGTKVFDWQVPDEWTIREAWIANEAGNRVVDFAQSNLSVVGYSTPVDTTMSLDELLPYIHSLPEQPDAVPYLTSYYRPRWGFCMTHAAREKLSPGRYRVRIDSELKPGVLNFGELVLPGREQGEVLLSANICHPSLGNNELSGPVMAAALAQWLAQIDRRYTYRLLLVPETIGSLAALSTRLQHMRRHTVAGFVLTCCGDDRAYSLVPSRLGGTLADRVATHVLSRLAPDYIRYSFLDRGSDERQYGAPGIDLPVVSVMRSMYGHYPEYHTSLDDLSLITPSGLLGAYTVLRRCIEMIEANRYLRVTVKGEPQLGKRGLYPDLSTKGSAASVRDMMNVFIYADGRHDLLGIAERVELPAWECLEIAETFIEAGLMEAGSAPWPDARDG